MRFKEFVNLSEEQSGTDKGLMGYSAVSSVRKPSDGQPFKNLSDIAGQTPKGNSGGGIGPNPQGPLPMMRKRMKKK